MDERLIITLGQSSRGLNQRGRHGCQFLKLDQIPCEVELKRVFSSGKFCTSSDSVILKKRKTGSVVIALDPESIELDTEVEISSELPDSLRQWHLPAISAYGSSGGTNAWDLTRGSSEIIVAVIDTGVDYQHPDLHPNIWINTGEIPGNGIDDDHNGFIDDVFGFDFHNDDSDPMDDNGHGTHCAGIIGDIYNLTHKPTHVMRISGVSPNVRIMSIKAMGENGNGRLSNVIAAVEYSLEMGAQITSNSFGTPHIDYSAAFDRLVSVLEQAGQLYVAAAGNKGRNTDNQSEFPASLESSIILSVAATNEKDQLASFSNYGARSVDLGAPGVKILSTQLNNRYSYSQGTSSATPLVAATAALVLSVYKRQGLDPMGRGTQAKQVILSSVDQVPGLKNRTLTGGRLNAARAVELAWNKSIDDVSHVEAINVKKLRLLLILWVLLLTLMII
eukprot:g6395.t1